MIRYKLLIYIDSISRGAGIVNKIARILFEDNGEFIEDFMWEINKSKFYFNDASLFEVWEMHALVGTIKRVEKLEKAVALI